MRVDIEIPCGMVTSKSVAWGGKNPELFKASQEAIRHSVQTNPGKDRLREWLENRRHLSLKVVFHLKRNRVHQCDLDSLLSDLLNPLVEGACGPRPQGRPIPQTKDALFWHVEARKTKDDNEKVVISIEPFGEGAQQ